MPCHISKKGKTRRIKMEGELTIYTAQELHRALLPCLDKASQLEIDLSQVSEMDSAGLQLLIMMKRAAAKRGVQLSLNGHSSSVTDVFDTLNMAAYFGDPIVLTTAA